MSTSDDKPATRLVTAGRQAKWTQGIVNVPVWRASTHLFESVAALREASKRPNDGLYYGRRGAATQWALADALTSLEPGAAGTTLHPSGVAAITTALLAVLEPGDELLMVDSVYEPTRAFCDGFLARLGVTTRYYDPLVRGAAIEALFGPRTKAIFLESPGSLTFEVQDEPAIAAAAKAHRVVTLADNTWATAVLFSPIAAGVDLSIQSCSKYAGGHSDLMMGAVTAVPGFFEKLRRTAQSLGQCVSPDDAYLCSRGLRTLGVRMKQHGESGLAVANWLVGQDGVRAVLHPALEGAPGHDIWVRDFSGASGLFAFAIDGDDAARARLIDGLDHFGIGFSWGGFESLALPTELGRLRTATGWQEPGKLIRLHIGLEDPDDLIADLARGLQRAVG